MGCNSSKTSSAPSTSNASTTNDDLTDSEKDLENQLMSKDGQRGTTKISQHNTRPPSKVTSIIPQQRARSQMISVGNRVSPIKPIRTRSEVVGGGGGIGGIGGVGRTMSLIGRPGMAAHMSRKKLVKQLLLMYYKNACAENQEKKSSKLDHVSFRSMYREITLLGGRRQPSASMIRHLMMYLDKKHDSSIIMEFEVIGSVMRAVEIVLSGDDDDDASTPDLLMHVGKKTL